MNWRLLWTFFKEGVAAIAATFLSPFVLRTTTPPDSSPPNVVPDPPPIAPVAPQEPPTATKYDWSTPTAARHSARLICDEEGLWLGRDIKINGKFYQLKDILCACIMQESRFINRHEDGSPVKHQNWSYLNGMKVLVSTDWGVVQVNDYWHIGQGKDFPSVQYVLENPDAAVRWMARLFKAGKQSLWVSYTSGDYIQWL